MSQVQQYDAFGNPILNPVHTTNSIGVVALDNTKKERQKAKYWLNIGLMLPDPQTNQMKFVQVAGCGIGLDTATLPELKGSTEFQKLLATQIKLHSKLLDRVKALPVGESIVLPHQEGTFCLQLTHADTRSQDERLRDASADNDYLDYLAKAGV